MQTSVIMSRLTLGPGAPLGDPQARAYAPGRLPAYRQLDQTQAQTGDSDINININGLNSNSNSNSNGTADADVDAPPAYAVDIHTVLRQWRTSVDASRELAALLQTEARVVKDLDAANAVWAGLKEKR